MNYTVQATQFGHAFEKLMLSCRFGEKQRPSPLRWAHVFSEIMAHKERDDPGLTNRLGAEALFNLIVEEYHDHKGVRDVEKYQMKQDERNSTMNLTLYVSDSAKKRIQLHLNLYKWADSGLGSCGVPLPQNQSSHVCNVHLHTTVLEFST